MLSKVNTALWGVCCYAKGWDPDAAPSSWSVLMLLLLPSVLRSRQIRGSGKTPGIQGNDYPFPVSCERQRESSDLTWGGTLNSWRSDMGFIGWADPA